MYETRLKHNSPDSLIRRPSGLKDAEWDSIVDESLARLEANPGSAFMREFANVAIDRGDKHLLKLLGIDKVPYQNWEHTAYRFFRHFCPENFRNALNHSGMPFGRLVQVTATEFLWISEKTFNVVELTPLLESAGIEIDDNISVSASGKSDVENIVIVINGGDRIWEYYTNGVTKSFGDTMYLLKKSIIANTIKKGR